jgi:hypothetical protein
LTWKNLHYAFVAQGPEPELLPERREPLGEQAEPAELSGELPAEPGSQELLSLVAEAVGLPSLSLLLFVPFLFLTKHAPDLIAGNSAQNDKAEWHNG